MRSVRNRLAASVLAASIATTADAQRAGENAVANAEDAFGASVGNDSIGLYAAADVRGFSALDAGNARIDGLYFDQKSSVTARIRAGSAIRVGLSAQGFPFPAPTGVVDYRLREAGAERVRSTVVGLDPNLSPYAEFDTLTPLRGDRVGLAVGVGTQRDRRIDHSDADYLSYGASLHLKPTENLQVRTFFGRFDSFDDEAQASILVDGAYLPPEIERGRFYGADWADGRGYVQNAGVTARWEGSSGFGAAAGLFSSTLGQQRAFSLLFESVDITGAGDRTLIGRRDQRTASTSGEITMHRAFSNGPLSHRVRVSLRGRDVSSRYGGGAVVPLGPAVIGIPGEIPETDIVFGELSHDEIDHATVGIGYDGRWRSGELSIGLQKSDYRKEVRVPGRDVALGLDSPRLLSAAAAWHLNDRIALYGSFTEGLEESGIAPDNAANRGQVLPALRTHQVDAGLRIALTPDLQLVTGLFTVTKPYFNLDLQDGEFRELGDVRHRGLELSLSGTLSPRFEVLAGAVLMDPEVTGAAVEDGRVGARPLGQPQNRVLVGINYRPARLESWLLDATVTRIGTRSANLAATLETPAVTALNAGFRRSFEINSAPAVLRLQIVNVTDEFAWQVNRSGAFQPNQERTLVGSLAVDF